MIGLHAFIIGWRTGLAVSIGVGLAFGVLAGFSMVCIVNGWLSSRRNTKEGRK
jgi:hypothetical protein